MNVGVNTCVSGKVGENGVSGSGEIAGEGRLERQVFLCVCEKAGRKMWGEGLESRSPW